MVTIICENCGLSFEKKKPVRFCSGACGCKFNGRNGIVGRDKSSLQYFVQKYGEEEGLQRHIHKCTRISTSQMGRIGGFTGKTTSESAKQKISESLKKSPSHQAYVKKIKEFGLPEARKEHLRKKMKGTFSLNWFVEKYGAEEGQKKYADRSKRIAETTFFKEYNKTSRQCYSKKSQKLFWVLYKRLCLDSKQVYFGELNHEYGCGTSTNFDFVVVDDKKVIEFNGNMWHANPRYFKEDDRIRVLDLPAKEVWEKDKKKNAQAEENGFKVLVVWEYDFDSKRKETIEECVKFLTC